MSSSVFPTFTGAALELTRTPLWNTMKVATPSGREYRGSFQLYPRYRYTLQFNHLRDTATVQEFRSLMGFYNLMKGSWDTFLYTDPDDSVAANANFGTGTGSLTTFQLLRTLGGFVDLIYDLNGAPTIKVAGVTKTAGSDYTIGSTGVVNFTVAPANGAALTWSGSYYWRCRFDEDSIDFDKMLNLVWSSKKVSFTTCKP